ncbi:hypothetical protein [Bacillus bingmayongensis]|uniref:hypothetical protein n=1 Tax=Bacillus bingmayongensis TaxID=1150157 RepID=UPI0021AE7876|nr:hypothetical protein [Bacillus bingmayongensis]
MVKVFPLFKFIGNLTFDGRKEGKSAVDLMYLLTDEKGLGTFKITNSVSDTWIETIVSVREGERRLRKKGVTYKFRSIMVLSVGDRRIKSYVDRPLPIIGAVTTANFERIEE